MIERMLAPDLGNHGLGPSFSSDRVRFGHGGANEGFRCQMTAFLDRDQGAVIMTNSDRGASLSDEILLTIAREYRWPGLEPDRKKVIQLPADRLEAIAGTYQAAPGQIRIQARGRGLQATFSFRQGAPLELLPESRESFFSLEGGLRLEVMWKADGTVESIRGGGLEFRKTRED